MLKKTKSNPHQMPSKSLSLSASWILRGCKHPRTPSFSMDNKETYATDDHVQGGGDEATLSDVDRFLMENFKSLYREEREFEDVNGERRRNRIIDQEETPSASPNSPEPPGVGRNSHRLFVESSSSRSLIEESRISLTLTSGSTTDDLAPSSGFSAAAAAAAGGGQRSKSKKKTIDETEENVMGNIAEEDFITVLRFSANPYDDFKKSMEEIVEARLDRKGKIDWEFMEEVLFYYLKLNDKKSYRFILKAFVDLIVVLRKHSNNVPHNLLNLGSNPSRHDDI